METTTNQAETSNNEMQSESIQKCILEGRRVVLKKENELCKVRVRYNNTDTDGKKKWRVIIMGNEFFTSEVVFNLPSKTFSEDFEKVGVKHHIMCDANEVVFKNNVAYIN